MKPITKIWIILMTALLFSSCVPRPQITGTAAASDQQVKAIAENVLQALDEGNYEIFHKDFSQAMLTAFPETEFTKLRDILLTSSGKYESMSGFELQPTGTDQYVFYVFTCTFEKETVQLALTFAVGGDKIEGLFLNSENLRSSGAFNQ